MKRPSETSWPGEATRRRGIRYLHPRNVETHFISLPLSGVGRPTARRGAAAGDEGPHIVTSHGRATKRAAGRSSSFWYKTAVEGEGSLRLFQHLWGSNERWSMVPRLRELRGSQEVEITQLRSHLLADPNTSTLLFTAVSVKSNDVCQNPSSA